MGSSPGVAMLYASAKVFLATQAIDMRKSYQGLGILVEQVLRQDPFSGYQFVFYNKRRDRLKILHWHMNEFCIWQKRLERGRFQDLTVLEGSSLEITACQLQGLLQGIEWKKIPTPTNLSYKFL